MWRGANGLSWVGVFNARDRRPNSTFQADVDGVILQAISSVKLWPTHDLFSSFP